MRTPLFGMKNRVPWLGHRPDLDDPDLSTGPRWGGSAGLGAADGHYATRTSIPSSSNRRVRDAAVVLAARGVNGRRPCGGHLGVPELAGDASPIPSLSQRHARTQTAGVAVRPPSGPCARGSGTPAPAPVAVRLALPTRRHRISGGRELCPRSAGAGGELAARPVSRASQSGLQHGARQAVDPPRLARPPPARAARAGARPSPQASPRRTAGVAVPAQSRSLAANPAVSARGVQRGELPVQFSAVDLADVESGGLRGRHNDEENP
jgi:hypothetical protein